MKNVHVLPTDKPSRLSKSTKSGLNAAKKEKGLYESGRFGITTFNIYITSGEEDINENDYIITLNKKVIQVSYILSEDVANSKKIILTTDQDLIKDGVQVIDDEFLEWFVRNPSCEEVEVEKEQYHQFLGMKKLPLIPNYKIIIPKEELERGITITHIGKQETLEEAAENYAIDKQNENASKYYIALESFQQGAKWQQERSYSEEEAIEFAKWCAELKVYDNETYVNNTLETLFEQFKNK